MSFWEGLLNLLFPPKCPFCGRVMDAQGICQTCQKTVAWTLDNAERYIRPGAFRCAAPLWYEGLVREGILRYKFQGCSAAAEIFGALIGQCAAEHFSGEFDVVTWVPVSRKRRRKRGYDQSELLAQAACRLWDVQPERLLRKWVHNPAQSSLGSAAERQKNVQNVYQPVHPERIQNRRILLVDDICTTGCTLSECVRTLRAAGASDVLCAVLALAVPHT